MVINRCAKVLGVIVGLSMLPLYLIAQCAFPSADDFVHLGVTAKAWAQTNLIIEVIVAARENTLNNIY